MNRLKPRGLTAAMTLGLATAANAVTIFQANLNEAQEIPTPANPLGASGVATLTLNDAMDRLVIEVTLNGVDLDGAQTADPSDNVTGFHIHRAPRGATGGVVFGFIGPNSDLNGDLMIDAAAGTVTSAWDLAEGNGTTLAAELGNLTSRGLYLNLHTAGSPSGQIRGQVVSAPQTLALIAGGLMAVGFIRRR